MKILFTGFNGFNNTSKVIIDKINNDKLLLNNSYKEIDNQLVNINFINYHFRGIIKTIKACIQNFHILFNSLPISCFI